MRVEFQVSHKSSKVVDSRIRKSKAWQGMASHGVAWLLHYSGSHFYLPVQSCVEENLHGNSVVSCICQ